MNFTSLKIKILHIHYLLILKKTNLNLPFDMQEYPIYTAGYKGNQNKGEIYEELIEGSHIFFHDEPMNIAQGYKAIFD
ncbi:hypothetical protein [Bacillus sp. JJ722]|uniref:hypothetical protein n=1 Tax=Bacillus sp. JJ722 TaxID=3122973 RepID=UPI002FFDDA68